MPTKTMTVDMMDILDNPVMASALIAVLFHHIAEANGCAPCEFSLGFSMEAMERAERAYGENEVMKADLVFGENGSFTFYTEDI